MCLQETHSDSQEEERWVQQFGSDILFSHGATNSRGVMIMVNPKRKQEIQLESVEIDEEGRMIIAKIVIGKSTLMLVNLYAPNNDEPEFFCKFGTQISRQRIRKCYARG